MKEPARISKLFTDLYAGDPWIDVTLLPNLKKLTAKQAAKRIYQDWNTIWEIVNHMISWREVVLQRIQGNVIKTPAHNYIMPIQGPSPGAWQKTLENLQDSQDAWIRFLKKCKTGDLENQYPGSQMTYYELIHGILQHDAYHLGQIVIMAKRVMA